jgi:hypothetical protein
MTVYLVNYDIPLPLDMQKACGLLHRLGRLIFARGEQLWRSFDQTLEIVYLARLRREHLRPLASGKIFTYIKVPI